ncbi:DUF1902 domain-containing protein [Alsobacter sp. KACC 23698]|uniref:DUF1902 domain-containing protein n=1 Tax=Alsobacter sp. KACC 23698 TaxID=3149229 RepID=A0AAU7JCA4_9HYPH
MVANGKRSLIADVSWDAEAGVWISECRDLPIFTEAETLDQLRTRVPLAAADYLADGDDTRTFDFDVSLNVRFGETVNVAA